MNTRTRKTLLVLALGCLVAAGASAQGSGLTVEVTVTNLTSGQIFSPPVVVSHGRDFELFAPAQAASPELAMLAEDAVSGPLISALGEDDDVFAVELGARVIPPGGSATVNFCV